MHHPSSSLHPGGVRCRSDLSLLRKEIVMEKVVTDRIKASPKSRRRRRSILAGVAALALSAGAVGSAAGSADAAGPTSVAPRNIAVFPTWFWSSTRVCVYNESSSTYAKVRVTPFSNPWKYDDIYAGPQQTSCILRSWWGSPIVANNLGTTHVQVTTY